MKAERALLIILIIFVPLISAPVTGVQGRTNSNLYLTAGIPGPAANPQVPVEPARAPQRLLYDLKHGTKESRRDAAIKLGNIRAKEAVKPLIDALSDKEPGVREAAAFALGQIASPAAAAALSQAIRDSNAEVRASAAFAYGMLGDPKATAEISNALDDSDISVRSSAIIALGLLQDDGAVDELIDLLNDRNFDIRYDAAWALGQIGSSDAPEALRKAVANIDPAQNDESMREAFRIVVQNSLQLIESQEGADSQLNTRPRRIGEPSGGGSDTSSSESKVNDRPPSVQIYVKPVQTERAARWSVKGSVSLRILISTGGRPVRAYITRRAGFGLDQRALEAVLQYKFNPAIRGGIKQVEWLYLEVKF